MPRWIRILLKFFLALTVVGVIFIGALNWYVNSHEKEILQKINGALNDQVNGQLQIEDMDPSLLAGFPNVSVILRNVTLRDSLWDLHHHDLVNAGYISIELNPFSLLSGEINVKQVNMTHGSIFLYTDSQGYTNASVFRSSDKNTTTRLSKFYMEDVIFTAEDKTKAKLFAFGIRKMKGRINYQKDQWKINTDISVRINEFNFNTSKGSFLRNKLIETNLNARYTPESQELNIPQQDIEVDGQSVFIGALFSFSAQPAFDVKIAASKVAFHNITTMLTPAIASKFSFLKVQNPIDVTAHITGKMKFRDTPLVYVTWKVKNNTLKTPAGDVENCSFEGYYLNQVYAGLGHTDKNSMIALYKVNASWLQIPLTADSIKVYDLKQPFIQCNVKANFPVKALNPIIGGDVFAFSNGTTAVDISYNGRFIKNDTTSPNINGTILIRNAAIAYLPRKLYFKNCAASLTLKGADLYMNDVRVETIKSKVKMSGKAINLFNVFYHDGPESVSITWNVHSPFIDLEEYSAFFQPRTDSRNAKKATVSPMARRLDYALDISTVHLNLGLNRLSYKKFEADNISATVILDEKEINFPNVHLAHAGGIIQVSGSLKEVSASTNSFNLNAHVERVAVDKLFYSFSNFGQDAILDNNIRGDFYADVSAYGLLRGRGRIVPNSIKGSVDFELKNGALLNFKPLEKVGKLLFKKRNLSNITFEDIKNRLEIDGEQVTIYPMHIGSSVLNIDLAGVYGFKRGTDISMQIPLRNPQKDEMNDRRSRRKAKRKGIVLYLKAVDDGNNGVKITWDRTKGVQDTTAVQE